MSNHSDPHNASEIIAECTDNNLIEYISRIFPDWIVKYSPQFSEDLFKFNEQWAYACAQIRVRPQKILLVKDTYLGSNNHKVIREFCKRLISNGYVVMDVINFDTCESCQEVIVSKQKVEEHKKVFSGKCQRCL